MSESPDFDTIARGITDLNWGSDFDGDDLTAAIVETLRRVWNARGTVDAQSVDELPCDPQAAARGFGRSLRSYDAKEAIRKADR